MRVSPLNLPHSTDFIRFGAFELDRRARELRNEGRSTGLPEQSIVVLEMLLGRPGELVLREEIRSRLWPNDTVVEFDHSINTAVRKLRVALGESADNPRYIETLARRGYRWIGSAEVLESREPLRRKAPRSPIRRGMVAVGGLALLAIGTSIIWPSWRHAGTTPTTNSRENPRWHAAASAPLGRIMMAVLPFQNLTGDPDQEYLTDGLTEETIARLGALQPEALGVIARTSVMGYKHGDKRLDQIGRELDVQYVLEGSVRRDRNRWRITAQLIQVKDQSHLWAQVYDRSLQDIIALQDDVAAGVTKEIQARWAIESGNHPLRHQPVNPEAHDAYFRGRYSLNQRTKAGLQNALGYFHTAIDADPGYALAYAGLADCYVLMLSNYDNSAETTVLQARTAANQALALDPGLGEPHAVLALIAQNHDWNWEESEREFKLAMAADPADPTAHFWYSNGLVVRGRFDEGFREMAIARRLDPLSLPIGISEAAEFYLARRYDDALGESDRILEIEPNYASAYLYRGLSYEQKGMWKEALADLEMSKRLDDSPFSAAMLGEAYALTGDKTHALRILSELQVRAKREHVSPLYAAILHAGLGDKDLAFSELQAAVEERSTNVLAIKVAALFDPLRSDPRFADLIRRVGLPPN